MGIFSTTTTHTWYVAAVSINVAACSNLASSRKKVKKVWQPDIVTQGESSEMIKSMQSSLPKLCILLIISDDIAFVTISGCHTFGLKLDKKTSNQMETFAVYMLCSTKF